MPLSPPARWRGPSSWSPCFCLHPIQSTVPQQLQESSLSRNRTKSRFHLFEPSWVSHCTQKNVQSDLVPASSQHFISFHCPPGPLRGISGCPLLYIPDPGPLHTLVPCPECSCSRYLHDCAFIINISAEISRSHEDLVLPPPSNVGPHPSFTAPYVGCQPRCSASSPLLFIYCCCVVVVYSASLY